MYYNTTNQTGATLKEAHVKSVKLADRVMDFFESHPVQVYTPFEVLEAIGGNVPITSVRRAMTDLTKEGKLYKSKRKRLGDYGAENYCWGLTFKTTLF